ncbi:MAG TPA: deoxyribodipyrimidine photo-lyase, partial [Acidimicrobiales bacterium]|nr:deoxyribodipyrimidine photo-lyase [Acidimicrobiales bacterium]
MKGNGARPAIAWFRRDLRLDDLPALSEAAVAGHGRVVPLFVADPVLLGRSGPNRRAFLAGALESLSAQLGGDLCLRAGNPATVVPQVAAEVGAKVVVVSGDYAPYGRRRDSEVGALLAASGVELRVAGSSYVHSPGTVRSAGSGRLQTFSSYFRAWERFGWPAPRPAPAFDIMAIESTAQVADVLGPVGPPAPLARAGLPDWWGSLPLGRAVALPDAGEEVAAQALGDFLAKHLDGYPGSRDMLGSEGTSHLSPYLRFGCLHPRTVLEAAGTGRGADRLRAELAWREFYADVLWHEPRSAREPLQSFGHHLRWDTGAKAQDRFRAWATGHTGFPLVDAAMRQLLLEGWVHNRARMVAASFLVKDLHLDW